MCSSDLESTTANRRGDGRARIGDPCPGLEGTLRPAVNGENLVCAGGPVPRWTVILDEPSPTTPSDELGEATGEPRPTPGNGNGNGNGIGPGHGNGNPGNDGHGNGAANANGDAGANPGASPGRGAD